MEFGDGTGGVRNSMTEFHGGILFIVEAGDGAHLAVIAAEDADPGLVGHNMDELVEQIGDRSCAPGPRFAGKNRRHEPPACSTTEDPDRLYTVTGGRSRAD